MKKTKVIVKKPKPKQTKQRQKQKQKQSVNVNVNIDQSKRTTARKPKSDKASDGSNTLSNGENYVKSNPYSYLPPPTQLPSYKQLYGQLQPVGNTSDSMNRMIENGQNYNSVVPHQRQDPNNGLFNTGPTYNVLNVALQARKIQDEINSNLETFERLNSSGGNVEFLDDENDENDDEPVPALEPNEPEVIAEEKKEEPKNEPSQSQSQSQSQVIDEPKNVTRAYLNALKPAQVRAYAAQLGIPTEEKNKTNDYYKDVSKNKLINTILLKLKNA